MDSATREDMKQYYTEMAEKAEAEEKLLAEKQSKRDAMIKLKEENPQEYSRLKAERAKAQKLEKQQRKAAQLVQNTVEQEVVLDYELERVMKKIGMDVNNSTKVRRVIEETSNGNIMRYYSIDGNELIYERIITPCSGIPGTNRVIRSVYSGNSKTTDISIVDPKTGQSYDLTIEKIFKKNKKGKYELVSRNTSTPSDHLLLERKVIHLEEGNVAIVERTQGGAEVVTIKDKKGKNLAQDIKMPETRCRHIEESSNTPPDEPTYLIPA